MKNIFFLCSFVFVTCTLNTSCKKEEGKEDGAIPKLVLTGSTISPIPITGASFMADIAYDNFPETKFDLFVPATASATNKAALVIFVHGGGFVNGDKSDAYSNAYVNDIQYYLNANIAFMTVSYRLAGANSNNGDTILRSINDVKHALQFIRYYSFQFNINKTKVAMYGGSAGGGCTLWIGLQNNMANSTHTDPVFRESTSLKALGHINSQASYSPFTIDSIFTANSACAIPNGSVRFPQLDFINFMSANDPELFIYQPRADITCSNPTTIPFRQMHFTKKQMPLE